MAFYNISNHPTSKWGNAQLEAARKLSLDGEIIDLPFPNVNPRATTSEVAALAAQTLRNIPANSAVMIQGESALAFVMILVAYQHRLRAVVATTERKVVETTNGNGEAVKTATFEFVGFRDVHGCAQWTLDSLLNPGL